MRRRVRRLGVTPLGWYLLVGVWACGGAGVLVGACLATAGCRPW
jgi:hypothetical protein